MQPDPPVRRTLGFLLADTSRLMRRHFVQRSREMGLPLNRSEASVLVHVDREPGLSQAQLAEKMDLEPISLVRLVDSLQEAGLIERRSHAHDRRIRTLWLTKAARPILVQVRAVAEDVRARALVGTHAGRPGGIAGPAGGGADESGDAWRQVRMFRRCARYGCDGRLATRAHGKDGGGKHGRVRCAAGRARLGDGVRSSGTRAIRCRHGQCGYGSGPAIEVAESRCRVTRTRLHRSCCGRRPCTVAAEGSSP